VSAARAGTCFVAAAFLAACPTLTSAQTLTTGIAEQGPRFVRLTADASRDPVAVDPSEIPSLNRRIALSGGEMNRVAALQAIGLAANVHFVYADDVLAGAGAVRIRPDSITVAVALLEVLAGAGVDIAVAKNENLILVRRLPPAARYFHGTLRMAARGAPVAAAIVTLIDTSRTIQAKARSDEHGRFVLRTTDAGLVSLRIQRIGVRPFESAPFRLSGDTTALIALDELPAVALPTVSSTAVSACHRQSASAETVWNLWDDVRTALIATSITYSEQRSRFSLAQVKRIYDTPRLAMRDIVVLEQTLTAQQPWTSLAPDILSQRGYVRFADERLTFASPDLDVLLSRSFENTHCFQPALLRDGELLGLSFEPASTLQNHTDIAGTFWVDAVSHELRRLTFHYTGLPFSLADSTGVSTVKFAQLEAQDWFIASWTIRAPIPALLAGRAMRVEDQLRLFGEQVEGVDRRPFRWRAGGLNEQRGDVLGVYREPGRADSSALWTAPTGAIHIQVFDGVREDGRRTPVLGAEVTLIGSRRQRMSDEAGSATFDHLTEGEYQVAVNSRTNAQLLEPPRVVVVRVMATAVTSAGVLLKSPGEIVRERCGADRHAIVGTVSRDGAPVADARLAVYDISNSLLGTGERVEGELRRSNAEGRFMICGRPGDATSTLEVRVRGPDGDESSTAVQLTPETTIDVIEAVLPSHVGARLP
jgi:hypothetical protein